MCGAAELLRSKARLAYPERIGAMTELSIKMWQHNACMDFSCVICGRLHQQSCAAVSVVDEELSEGDTTETVGDICPDCLAAGAEHVQERAHKHAEEWRTWANAIDALGEGLAGVDWPTVQEWEAFEDKVQADIRLE